MLRNEEGQYSQDSTPREFQLEIGHSRYFEKLM
jgi:hypothetical protein